LLIETKVTAVSALYLSAKNAAATLLASAPLFYATIAMPDLPLDAALWGTLGGLLRWLITRCAVGQGLLYLGIGGLMASGFDGYQIPFLVDILPKEAPAHHAAPFFIGTFGVVIYGLFEDTLKVSPSNIIGGVKGLFKKEPTA
jgi:hypothetical protein